VALVGSTMPSKNIARRSYRKLAFQSSFWKSVLYESLLTLFIAGRAIHSVSARLLASYSTTAVHAMCYASGTAPRHEP
jgi:hypothetical protein